MTERKNRESKRRVVRSAGSPLAIVGIGASATSFGSLEQLFARRTGKSGLAYIVALKTTDSLNVDRVVEAVGRQSGMPAEVAADGVRLKRDCIYVAPSDSVVTVADGMLQVAPVGRSASVGGAIDSLLVSLADENERAIAVVLAGLGSDGTLGVSAIKKNGGLALAEMDGVEPVDVAISPAGIVDFLLPVQDLPEQIVAYARHLGEAEKTSGIEALTALAADYIPRIATILRNRTGHDFHGYKPNTFLRRVQRRMHVVQVDTLDAYVERLGKDAEEVGHLFQDLLIGVTQFFRDKPEFELLEREVIPQLFKDKGIDDHVRVWVLGCASGEEAYSMAILLREQMAKMDTPPHVQIFATDIDGRALALARSGRYPESIAKDITPERLARWFVREGATYCVHKDLREMCIFSAHNVIKDAPFSRIDLISCRNLLIYLNSDLQDRVIPLFHFALKPGGFLFLGPSESVTRQAKLFEPLNRKHKIFKRLETATRVMPEFPLSARTVTPAEAGAAANMRARAGPGALGRKAERIAERYMPAYVIVDSDYEVLHFSGRTGRYLEPSAGAANLSLLSLIHRDLRLDLRAALHGAAEKRQVTRAERLRFGSPGQTRSVTLVVEPAGGEDTSSFVVIFQDHGAVADQDAAEGESDALRRDEHVQRLDSELRLTKERLQATIEELESTNEELKSSNEEYQSINEELQSANEELETSKEELQSVNEELQTVNGELAHRVTELAKSNSDLKNLLENTQIATIFLDNDLRVRNFTPTIVEMFHILDSDIGRPIAHIAGNISYPEMQDDVRKVLRSLTPVEREIDGPDDGRRFLVRVLPYRSVDNFIGGVVLTFLDVTAAARAESALRESEARYRLILDSASEYAIVALDLDGKITGWNVGAANLMGWSEEEVLGRPTDIFFTPEDRRMGAHLEEMRTADREGRAADQRWHLRKDGTRFWGSGMLTPIRDGALSGYLKIMRDGTAERDSQERQKLLLAELQHRVRNILAVVRSLANRSVETSSSLDDFASHFDGRLAALGRTQSIFARTGEVAVELDELVRDELVAIGAGTSKQVSVSGPTIRLRQHAGEAFALALHELATNAVKYGALATPKGKVAVNWRTFNTSDGPRLSLEWRESGVPAINAKPKRTGFGRELIEHGLPYELGAATSLTFEPSGVRALIELPLNEKTVNLPEESTEAAQ